MLPYLYCQYITKRHETMFVTRFLAGYVNFSEKPYSQIDTNAAKRTKVLGMAIRLNNAEIMTNAFGYKQVLAGFYEPLFFSMTGTIIFFYG